MIIRDVKFKSRCQLLRCFNSFCSLWLLSQLLPLVRCCNSMIVFPQYLNGAEAATIKERELLSKQSSKAGSVSDIVIKPNHIIKITIVRNPPKNLKVRNVTKLNQEGTLH